MRWAILADPERRFLLAAVSASLAAISLDNWMAPALHNRSPFWALAFLLALLLRRRTEDDFGGRTAIGLKSSWTGVALFVLLHAAVIAAAQGASRMLVIAAGQSTVSSGAIASLKLLVLLPTLALFPPSAWKRLAQKYRAELVVWAFVLFTWNPFRIFETVWPWYSEWLGRFVYGLSGLFVVGLRYVPGTAPTLAGPDLDVSILFGCSGLNGVKLFQVLFGVVLLVDWDRLKKMRTLAVYLAGIAAMIFANALRITLLVVLGNSISPEIVARFHVNAGWVFFLVVFLGFLAIAYRGMLGQGRDAVEPIPLRPAV